MEICGIFTKMEANLRRTKFLQDWAASTAEFMKSLDGNHLLTLGAEGFLGSSTPGPPLHTITCSVPLLPRPRGFVLNHCIR